MTNIASKEFNNKHGLRRF